MNPLSLRVKAGVLVLTAGLAGAALAQSRLSLIVNGAVASCDIR